MRASKIKWSTSSSTCTVCRIRKRCIRLGSLRMGFGSNGLCQINFADLLSITERTEFEMALGRQALTVRTNANGNDGVRMWQSHPINMRWKSAPQSNISSKYGHDGFSITCQSCIFVAILMIQQRINQLSAGNAPVLNLITPSCRQDALLIRAESRGCDDTKVGHGSTYGSLCGCIPKSHFPVIRSE